MRRIPAHRCDLCEPLYRSLSDPRVDRDLVRVAGYGLPLACAMESSRIEILNTWLAIGHAALSGARRLGARLKRR